MHHGVFSIIGIKSRMQKKLTTKYTKVTKRMKSKN
jgi:hypothetical protein